jgi:hypothetical protein|tara:strand:- start:217 stop:675 length:459 start_codon:yes stop_codon:yes gene_type:complete
MTIAKTEDTSSESSPKSRFDQLITELKGSKISKSKLREEVFNILLDDATESPSKGKYYTFEYDPKFADNLKEWDEYPLIYVMEFKKNNLIGANIHYIRGTNSRLKALNNKRFPKRTLRQYIPKRADSIFFEIGEDEVQILSTLPIEKFHYNR